MSRKIAVVTGCASFIGINLTEKLLSSGWYVYGIDKLTYVANSKEVYKLAQGYKKFEFIHKFRYKLPLEL